jgi:flavin reductase (DIM6/NTAB) family NADH-FMN oxidoreductase RutF
MFYDPKLDNHGMPNSPFKAIIAPRPIAWISTISASGIANLAPYSFFNAMGEDPHYVAFGSGGYKDSLANIEETGCFAVNLVSHDLREPMNASAATVAGGVDEFELAGVEKASCRKISAPRVAVSPACLECEYYKKIDLPNDDGSVNDWIVIGRVVGIHIADQFIQNGRVNTAAMQLAARLGYSEYATVLESWKLRRPE